MSQSGSLKFGGGGGGTPITTINGDFGSVSGSTVTIFANNASNVSGGTVLFNNSGTTSTLHVTDVATVNTFVGFNSGNITQNGTENVAFGPNTLTALDAQTSNNVAIGNAALQMFVGSNVAGSNQAFGNQCLSNLISGNLNFAAGIQAGQNLVSGNSNCFVGNAAGAAYMGAESSNVAIGNSGVLNDNHTIRIGTQGSGTGQQNTAFMAGIVGNTVSNAVPVTINSSTGQFGVGAAKAAFSVNLSNGASGTNVTGDATTYQVPFDVVLVDTASGFTTGASAHYTIPAGGTGNWQFQCNVDCFPQTGSGTQAILLLATTSHSVTMQNTVYPSTLLNNQVAIGGSVTLPMTAGDTVSLTIQWSGGTKTTDIFGSANVVTWLSGSLI